MHTNSIDGAAIDTRCSVRFILVVKALRFLLVAVVIFYRLYRSQQPSDDDDTRGCLSERIVPRVVVVSAWLPITHRRCRAISYLPSTTCPSLRLAPILYKKKTTTQRTDDNHHDDSHHDIGSPTTASYIQQKQQERLYEQNLILELQRCITVDDVLYRVGSLLLSSYESTNDGAAATTTSSIQISSLIFIRLSKLYIQMNNQQIYHVQQQQSQHDVTLRIPGADHDTGMELSSMSILHNIIQHFVHISSKHSTNMLSSYRSTVSSIVDAMVDGTKACAVLSRLIPLTWNAEVNTLSVRSTLTIPLVEFYTSYGSGLIPYMQPHHISGLKWALDSLLLLTPTSTDDSNATIQFPQSIQDAYTALNLPFCILPRCLSMMDDTNNKPITVDRMVRQVDFRTDEIYTTASGESVPERRLTAWQGDTHVAPFAYSGKAMDRNDWSPIVLHIRNQLYNLTGQYYDGCLLNLYYNGKSGMRYHSDPDQGVLWDYDTAVVSIGASRRFTFRSIDTATSHQQLRPHSFIVMDSDVTYMFNDCQQLYQHSVKNADNKNETTSRISLVFKRTYQYYQDN